MKSWTCLIAMGFGAGFIPFSPGTAGALLAVPIALIFHHFSFLVQGYLLIAMVFAGILICGAASRELEHDDHPAIVLDETLGALLVFLLIPKTFVFWVIGLLAFRFFDIVKPWPINLVQSELSGGIAIVGDDLAAAIPSFMFVWLLSLFLTF